MPPDPPGGAWTYLVPLVVLGLILLRGLRTRTLRVERMWIMPALVLLAFGMMLSRLPPPRPGMIAIGLAALALGVAAGWFLGLAAASLPYPDPTPAMLEAQQRSILGWQAGLLAGLGLSGLAAAGLWRARR